MHRFTTKLLSSDDDLTAVFRLRKQVFIGEMGANASIGAIGEQDRFDEFSHHLVVLDQARECSDKVVGVYRLLDSEGAARAGSFYCESEYDLAGLQHNASRMLELGRSCLHRDYRGGIAMFHLWDALKAIVKNRKIDVLFGVASFPGTDAKALAQPLSLLHYNYLIQKDLRPISKRHEPMDKLPLTQIDRKAAMVGMPALIKAYLRMGGRVGDGAFVDHDFNTVDICMILEAHKISQHKVSLR